MFCALDLVGRLVWLEFFGRILIGPNGCVVDNDALNLIRPN